MMDYSQSIAVQVGVRPEQVRSVIDLIDAENTIPFIARYRKEMTAGLDEEKLRLISELLKKLRTLDERRATVLHTIEEQGKLTPELDAQIHAAESLIALEDLYLPYKPKRRTRAMIARENGLQQLADLILAQDRSRINFDELASSHLNENVPTPAEAWSGACDIVAETISENPEVRRITREKALAFGLLHSEKIEETQDPRKIYEVYYRYDCRVDRLKPYQVLAINRGEDEKVLRVKVAVQERDWRTTIQGVFRVDPLSPFAELLQSSIDDAAERLLLPAINRDVRRELTEKSDTHAIHVFAANLRALLSQPPLAGYTVLGIDPGYRTGCKLAVVDQTGKLLAVDTIYIHESEKVRSGALSKLETLVKQHQVNLVTIGNGTASRETEHIVVELIKHLAEQSYELHYLIVSESGASVYSASPLARAELPELDVSLRGAVSIARRVQDPLAELVKIDPKSIGVGLYQHDVDQKNLADTLRDVVESVVNQVGVDVNTASPALLEYVSGIGPKLAEQIVEYRNKQGPFLNRNAFLNVPKLGPKAFEQSAGFLRIRDGDDPLDASAIHPESYSVARQVLDMAELSIEVPPRARQEAISALLKQTSLPVLARGLGVGLPTLTDIIEQLVRPGRDPRQDLPRPVLRSDILSIEDLAVGMRMRGTVRNVVDFGVFVDIGVKQDGLLHISQMPKDLSLKIGDIIEVEVHKLELERSRIGLKYVTG